MKKIYFIILGCFVGVMILVSIVTLSFKAKALTCTREESLITGFNSNEVLKVKYSNKTSIANISLEKDITLSEYYDIYGTYYDSLKDILTKSYKYLGEDFSVKVDEKKVSVRVDIDHDGIVLNNLNIRYNGEEETTLRYDAINDLNDASAIKLSDKVTKKELKSKLKDLGYTCK